MNLQPIRLTPAFKDYLWGGAKLKTDFNKQSDLEKVAESWELSTHKDGQSIVADGEFQGLTLTEYINKQGNEILGTNALKFDYFPILIKFIDAKDNLSVQVHPDDAYGLAKEGEYGKTEMWYILDCEEGASLYYGVNTPLSREEFAARIENNTLLDVLNRVEVKKGDVFFIPAGTVHAIGKGIVICEIQQNSNTTYRVYDYDRRDKDGNPRQLHVQQAIAVADLTPAPARTLTHDQDLVSNLAQCQYFTVNKIRLTGAPVTVPISTACFQSLIMVDGSGTLSLNGETYAMNKGDSFFIPAQDSTIYLEGTGEIIQSYL